ncbi:MAG: hypothetical protein Fur0011_6300 [Candidatus Microgenomates bacterium]
MATIKEALQEERKYLDAIREQVTKAGKDRSETGRIACASLRGQEQMQNLFVGIGDAIQEGALKLNTYGNPFELDGNYKGEPVKVAIEEFHIHNRDNRVSTLTENGVEIMLTEPETGVVLKNIYMTTSRNDRREELGMPKSYSWSARSIDHPKGWKKGDGGGDRPETKTSDVMLDDGIEGFEKRNGMSEDMFATVQTVENALKALTPFMSNAELPTQ